MLSKEVDNLIDEFILLNNKIKFKRKYICYFSNGVCANHWFKKNQDEILSTSDKRCEVVKKQYQEYIDFQNSEKQKYSTAFHMILFSDNVFLKEFIKIKDNSKYEPNCEIYLSNGVNAYDFFQKIIEKVMTYNDSLLVKIREDYLIYKMKKKKLNYKKTLVLFYQNKGYGKFDIDSHVKLQNDVDAGIWFNNYKDFILEEKGPIETKIDEQYEVFLTHYDLAKEFLEEKNLDKFNVDSNVRFISHALMNLWWEDNEEKIMFSDLNLDKLIINQHEEYIKEKKL